MIDRRAAGHDADVNGEWGLRGNAVLRLPVRARGVELGQPTDLIVDVEAGKAVGVDVLCADRQHRFLPLAAATIEDDRIRIRSALILLEESDASFYREHAQTVRELRGREVEQAGRSIGPLVDVLLGDGAALHGLLVDTDGGEICIPLADRPEIAAL